MTLGELKEIVQELTDNGHPDEVKVLFGSQPSWPFESSIAGWCLREDFADLDADEPDLHDGRNMNDIFLIEGRQLRYGSKDMFDAAR